MAWTNATTTPSDSTRARTLWLDARNREAVLDLDSAEVLYRRAIDADGSFLPAHVAYLESRRFSRRSGARSLRAEYLDRTAHVDAGTAQCLAIAARADPGYVAGAVPELFALEQRAGSSACVSLFVTLFSGELAPRRLWLDRLLAYSEQATRDVPTIPDVWIRRATLLLEIGKPSEATQIAIDGAAHMQHATDRARIQLYLVSLYRALGDTLRARTLLSAIDVAITRDARPYLRLVSARDVPRTTRDPKTLTDATSELQALRKLGEGVRAHAPRTEWSALRELGVFLSDAGHPRAAMEYLNRAVRIADSLDAPLMQLDSYRFRGRTLSKLGRWRDAERDLLHAIDVGARADDQYFLAEAWHNLAHAYEGEGKLQASSRAVDHFIALTRDMQYAQPRMMSLQDAGMIRWKAGAPASSNAAFAEMVRVVDEQERNYFWAGQYFERIGDFARAARYYRLGFERDRDETSLNLGGLTRIYRALGQIDSAEVVARQHDALMSNQRDVPLLPAILAERGRREEAEHLARQWARQHAADGNVQAFAVATNSFAELLLSWGNMREAIAEATDAEQLARRSNMPEEVVRAMRTQGVAFLRVSTRGSAALLTRALTLLHDARTGDVAHASSENTIPILVALGDALAAAGRKHDALAAYDTAARAVERVSAQLDRDLDRVRYRERQLSPFDGALRLLLREADAEETVHAIARWSARRKAAALTFAIGLGGRTDAHASDPETREPLRALQQRLQHSAAVIDYLVTDSALIAVVVRHDWARLVRVRVSADSLRRLVLRVTRPFHQTYGNRLDLARTVFDARAAQALGRLLISPLDSLLTDVTRLLVVPDGPLSALPFDALQLTLGPQPQFALDRFEITIAPTLTSARKATSASIASASSRTGIRNTRVLAVVRDVPGSDEEQRGIEHAWPVDHVRVLRDANATESAVRAQLPSADIVHFATHAFADDRDPLASYLQLAPDARDDGLWNLPEIAAQRRAPPLVILSACQTYVGPLYAGEGVMGLARAFLVSGARYVVATHWPTGAVSAAVMRVLHEQLAAGVAPATALRTGQREVRQLAQTAHPFFWASYVIVTADPLAWAASSF